ncbi:MAG: cation:dicarboxylase symporter family transporter [Acidobacteriota bacterium]
MKRLSLTTWILIAVVAGAIFGALFPEPATKLGLLGDIFLRLIQSVVAPLMFASLVVGVARAGSAKTMGRVGGKAFLLFQVTATLSLVIGIAAAVIAQPGAGISLAGDAAIVPQNATSIQAILLSPFPSSIVDALARGDILQIVVFALVFGFACSAIGAAAEPVVRFCESLSDVMFRYTDYVMYAAPLGIFGAMSAAIGTKGLGVLLSLGKLVLTVYAGLFVFVLLVLGPVAWIARVPLARFFAVVRQPVVIAFTTTSSNVGLPVALEKMTLLGVPRHIAALVLPFSMTFNTTGSNLFIALAAVFCAQAAGITLNSGQLTVLFLTLLLTTKGIGAVPRGSLVILAGALTQMGVPLEGVAMILGVDQLMDMARTGVNMLGHCLATAAVARWEGAELGATKA